MKASVFDSKGQRSKVKFTVRSLLEHAFLALLARYLKKTMDGIHQTLANGVLEVKDELIRLKVVGSKSRSQQGQM